MDSLASLGPGRMGGLWPPDFLSASAAKKRTLHTLAIGESRSATLSSSHARCEIRTGLCGAPPERGEIPHVISSPGFLYSYQLKREE